MKPKDVLRAAFPAAEPDSPTSFYGEVGDLFTALAFADLFWPQCFEVYGAIFVAAGPNSLGWVGEGTHRFMISPIEDSSSWADLVDSVNWFEVPYLLGVRRDPAELRGEAAYLLAATLQGSWSARLSLLYPDRRLDVSLDEPTANEALSVSVRQTWPDLTDPRLAAPEGDAGLSSIERRRHALLRLHVERAPAAGWGLPGPPHVIVDHARIAAGHAGVGVPAGRIPELANSLDRTGAGRGGAACKVEVRARTHVELGR